MFCSFQDSKVLHKREAGWWRLCVSLSLTPWGVDILCWGGHGSLLLLPEFWKAGENSYGKGNKTME